MGSQLSSFFEGAFPTGTLANFIFKTKVLPHAQFLNKWTDLTKGDLESQWP